MYKHKNNKLTPASKRLRKEMTKEERRLWFDFLKNLPMTINRQKVIGRYIVDFYCAEANVVIELDGSQHFEPEGKAEDTERDKYLRLRGVEVLRYSNYDVNTSFDAVCNDILNVIESRKG